MEIVEHHFSSLDSTNSYGKSHVSEFQRDKLTVVSAGEQNAGRGRFGGRRWVSPPDQIVLASFVFFIHEEQEDPLSLTHLLAITLIEVLEKYGVQGRVKWPNDVMVENKKIAGILCETIPLSPYFGVILGFGLNVNMPRDILETVGQPATSMFEMTQKIFDVKEVRQGIVKAFSEKLEIFKMKGFAPFLPTFRKYMIPGIKD